MENYVGEIRMFAGSFAPLGWAICDGTLLDISGNEILFSLIGTTYGGDGQSTFGLPDLRGRVPIHMGQLSGSGNTYTLGQKAGTETVTLLQGQLPSHTHTPVAETGNVALSPAVNVWAKLPASGYATYPSGLQPMSNSAVTPAGGSQPHDNMMPSLVINFIIALQGLYPQRS
ncbi:MAG: phage tail protein [Clostridia bacterium]